MKYSELFKKRISLMNNVGLHLKKNKRYFFLMFLCKLLLLLNAVVSPIFFKMLIDDVMIEGNLSKLTVICIGLAVLFLADSTAIFAERYFKNKFQLKTTYHIRCRVWESFTHMPYHRAESFNPGDIKNRIDGDINDYSDLIRVQLIDYFYYFISALVIGVITIILNWKLALFGLAMVPVSFWMTKRLGNGLTKASETYRKTWGKYEAWLQGSLQSWKEIKSLNAIKREERTFTRFWHALSLQFFKKQLFWYGNRGFIAIKDFFITRMNLYFVGGLLIFAGELSIGGLLVFMKYFEQFFAAIGSVTNADMHLYDFLPSFQRIEEMLTENHTPGVSNEGHKQSSSDIEHKQGVSNVGQDQSVKKKEHKQGLCNEGHKQGVGDIEYKQGIQASGKKPDRKDWDITLQNVCFTYPQKEEKTLHGINLHITKGEKLAIVGRSGCGKSTLIKMILGFYEPDDGRILLDGTDIRSLQDKELHRRIGAVMQDSMIFNLTIRENLLLAKPSANDEVLMEACQAACLDEFIEGLADGLDTLVGEKGIKLSGGQRQRMAIARVVLTKPPIIIFDEATSALDHQTEKAIHEVMERLSKDRTVIIVAHRLSSIIKADRVVIMEQGRIVGEGFHESLKGKHEIYDALFSKQYHLLDA